MHTIAKGYRGVSTLVALTWDRILITALLVGALYVGAFIALL